MGLLADLGGYAADIDQAEKDIASNGLVPEGVHHAILDGAGSLIVEGLKRGHKLTFVVIAGPGKDGKVEDVVWLPKGDDVKKDQRISNRLVIFGHRLGLLKKGKDGNGKETTVEVEGKTDFTDVIGAQCFINVKHEKEDYTDKKTGRPREIMKAKLEFEGLIAPDDKRVKDVVKGKPGGGGYTTPSANGTGATGGGAKGGQQVAAAKAANDFSDL